MRKTKGTHVKFTDRPLPSPLKQQLSGLDNKITRIENFLEQKKFEQQFDCRESSRGVITGLEIALSILKD